VVTFAAPAADEGSVWWLWVLGGLVVWLAVALLVGIVIGRGIRIADGRTPNSGVALTTADLPAGFAAARSTPATGVRRRRRSVLLPPVGVALAATAVLLETIGYVVRLTGAGGPAARLLSMDDELALPRMFVALLFAAAALAAVAGAGVLPGRRTWWLAVAAVGGGIASVKAGGSLHADAVHAVGDAIGQRNAVLVSAAAALAVVAVLWFLSRDERRDRRRVLGVLALYATASVGLSAVSSAVAGAVGGASRWAATATFLEESGEALAAVGFLVAVLVGVAPRLVLPADWALRRAGDEHTLNLPEQAGPYLPSAQRGSAGPMP
jgi:hypothetical protein